MGVGGYMMKLCWAKKMHAAKICACKPPKVRIFQGDIMFKKQVELHVIMSEIAYYSRKYH